MFIEGQDFRIYLFNIFRYFSFLFFKRVIKLFARTVVRERTGSEPDALQHIVHIAFRSSVYRKHNQLAVIVRSHKPKGQQRYIFRLSAKRVFLL